MSTYRDAHAPRQFRMFWCLLGVIAACTCFAVLAPSADADCTSGGSSCLPGSGYTFDQSWNCGSIADYPVECFYRETTRAESATTHTWGWGSAANNSGGTYYVTIRATGSAGRIWFSGGGNNLARACYQANCNDQEETLLRMQVSHWEAGLRQTIWGHGEA